MESVILKVLNGTISTDINALYDTGTSCWSATVPETLITAGDTVLLSATATDRAQNSTSAAVTVGVVADSEGPLISVASRVDGDQVPVTGFLLSGTATDLTGVDTMTATTSDPGKGDVVHNVSVGADGNWTVRINNGDITVDSTIQVTLDATDTNGNPGSAVISLNVIAVDYAGLQLNLETAVDRSNRPYIVELYEKLLHWRIHPYGDPIHIVIS